MLNTIDTYKILYNQLVNYKPVNEQEEVDKNQFLWLLHSYKEKAFERRLLFGHITASAIVLDKSRKYMLMNFHNIYKSWAWFGGHADGEYDLYKLSLKELEEESGLNNVKLICEGFSSIEILSVDSHIKKGKFVPCHLHYNVTYLYEADINEDIRIKEDENSALSWIKLDDLYEHVKDDHDMYTIYMKSVNRVL